MMASLIATIDQTPFVSITGVFLVAYMSTDPQGTFKAAWSPPNLTMGWTAEQDYT